MKKLIVLLLAALLLLSTGCGKNTVPAEAVPAPEPTPVLTPSPEPVPTPTPEPEWEPGYIRAGNIGVLWSSFDRGEEVTVCGELDGYYIVDHTGAELLVEKDFIRLETEEAPESRTAYAYQNAALYDNPYFEGEPLAVLDKNTVLNVVDEFGPYVLAEVNGQSGYMLLAQTSTAMLRNYTYGGGGGSDSGGSTGGQDGGDIALAYRTSAPKLVLLSNGFPESCYFDQCQGEILAGHVEAYLCLYSNGDDIKVISAGADTCTVLVGEYEGILPRWAVRLADEESYAPRSGFAAPDTVIYPDHRMLSGGENVRTNTPLTVLDEFADFFVVETDGKVCYVSPEYVNDKEITYSYSSGGGSSDAPPAEWTEPVL